MIGCYDFCGHYEWTFDWLEQVGGPQLLRDYWSQAIGGDSQRPTRELIAREGFVGMEKHWAHTLAEESPDLGFTIARAPDSFRIDMHDCPSKGFLLRNGLQQHRDYCDHCMGWVGPVMRDAGYVIDHEHNHLGQCWWLFRAAGASGPASPPPSDVRRRPEWQRPGATFDRYAGATSPDEKLAQSGG